MTDNVHALSVTLNVPATSPADTISSASSSDSVQAQSNFGEGPLRSTGNDDDGLLCVDAVNELFTIPVVERPLVNIEPPPEKTYASEKEAMSAIHQWTKDHGFNVTKRRAFYTDSASRQVWKRGLDCDRAGKPKCTQHLTDAERQRPMRGSIRIGCPMKLIVKAVSKDDSAGPWEIVHTRNGSRVHNHPPSEDVRVHPSHRRRAAASVEVPPAASLQDLVQAQTAVGITPGSVCASLAQADPNSCIIPQDISNMRNAARRREIASHTVMDALFKALREHDFYFRWEADPQTQQLLYLFWGHPGTLAQYRRHPDIVGMDCTYKTNKYKLPLLNIISLTGFNTVLPVAQCWLPREREEDYRWAMNTYRVFLEENTIALPSIILTDRELASMNAIDSVFPEVPTVICRWHMNKNVLSKTRQVLGQVPVQNPAPGQTKYENTWQTDSFMESFYDTVESITEAEFEVKRQGLHRQNRHLAEYLDNHWWKYKTKIVAAWTDRYKHFGVRDTSFVEGAHAKCKIWLRGCRSDLYTVFLRLLPWWQAAVSATSLLAERNSTRVPYLLQGNHFSAVARVITVWALTETQKLWCEARDIVNSRADGDGCTGRFRGVHGRPCVHDLISIIESNGQRILRPDDFDKHWWIRRDQQHALPVRIQEPMYTEQALQQRRRRYDRRSRNRPYTSRRDPVLFERVDLNHPATPPVVTNNQDPAVTVLPPLSNSIGTNIQDSSTYHEHNIPPRYWGYASFS